MILTSLFRRQGRNVAVAFTIVFVFVLRGQNVFDARQCWENIGEKVFEPWMGVLQGKRVDIYDETKVVGLKDGWRGEQEYYM